MKLKRVVLLIIAFVFFTSVYFPNISFAAEILLMPESECAPYAIFQQSEGVKYTVTGAETGSYIITDYFGEESYGSFNNGEIAISGLDTGHYSLNISSDEGVVETQFAVVPDLEERRDSSLNPLGFSAMATYTHTTNNVKDYNAYAKTISLAGVNYVREFINWKDLITNTKHLTKNRGLIEAYNANDIDVMLMIQDMPGENARNTQYYEKGNCITYDLNNAYNAIDNILQIYSGKIDAIEVLNEPDDMTEMDTADRYAALLKVASIAAAENNDDIMISLAGLAKCNGIFAKRLLQNDINSYIDIYDTHLYRNYSAGKEYIETLDEINEFMGDATAYGLSNKKLWMSEYGFRAEYENAEDSDLSETQFIQAARTAPIALIRANKSGVDKLFWFIHGYLKEDGKNGYGTLKSDHTPNLVYSALSAFTNALGNAGYSREIEADGVNVCIYSDGTEEIACVWSENLQNITLPVNSGKVTITDIMGREIVDNVADNTIEITAGPDVQYIRAENGFSDDSVEVVKYEKETSIPDFTKAQKVVMTPEFNEEASAMAASRAYALDTAVGKINEVKLKVYNFNDFSVNVDVECIIESGWETDDSVQSITIPARTINDGKIEGGTATVIFNISGNGTEDVFNNTPLVFKATVDGKRVSDTVTYITSKEINSNPINGSNDVSKWKLAATGNENNTSKSSISQDSDGIKMTCSFEKATKNKACRIEYNGQLSITDTSAGISFKCISPQTPETMLRVWLTDSDNDTFYSAYTVSLEELSQSGDDYTYSFPFENFKWGYGTGNKKLDKGSAKIKVGIMNPTVDTAEYSFKDFGLVQKNGETIKDIVVTELSYDDGVLTAQLSSDRGKNVKLLVLGNVFEGVVTGNGVKVNALLPTGTHKAELFVYDSSNRVFKVTDYITVSEDDLPDVSSPGADKNGAFVTNEGKVTVSGTTSKDYAGAKATLIVYPDNIAVEEITLSDLVYVDEILIDGKGKYSLDFDIKDYSRDRNYAYTLNINGKAVRSSVEEYNVVYSWQGAEIRFFRTEKALKVVTAMNDAPVDMQFITGMYDKNNSLTTVMCENIPKNMSIQKNEFEYEIPADVAKFSTYLWTADGNITPLQIPYISYRN